MKEAVIKMPSSYYMLDDKEMSYIEGGWCIENKAWGYNVYLTNTETKKLANGQSIIGLVMAFAGLGLPGAAAGAVVQTFGGIISNQNNGHGVRIRMTGLGTKTVPTGVFGLSRAEEKSKASKNKVIF